MNIIAHWSMNDPTELTKFWDNSGNKYHGSFGEKKPVVVEESPNGTRAMQWPAAGANVTLPTVGGTVNAVSFYVKKEASATINLPLITDTKWHMYAVVGGKVYVDGEQKGSQTAADIVNVLKGAMDGGRNFTLSDLYFYSDLAATEIDTIMHIRTSINKDKVMNCKEIVEKADLEKVQIERTGIVAAQKFTAQEENVSFKRTEILVQDIKEF